METQWDKGPLIGTAMIVISAGYAVALALSGDTADAEPPSETVAEEHDLDDYPDDDVRD